MRPTPDSSSRRAARRSACTTSPRVAPGFVAIGYAARPTMEATTWFSPDTVTWERIPLGDATSSARATPWPGTASSSSWWARTGATGTARLGADMSHRQGPGGSLDLDRRPDVDARPALAGLRRRWVHRHDGGPCVRRHDVTSCRPRRMVAVGSDCHHASRRLPAGGVDIDDGQRERLGAGHRHAGPVGPAQGRRRHRGRVRRGGPSTCGSSPRPPRRTVRPLICHRPTAQTWSAAAVEIRRATSARSPGSATGSSPPRRRTGAPCGRAATAPAGPRRC